MKPTFTTTGCTALVTGASSGLGAEFARQLARRSRHLILVARREERLRNLAFRLQSEFPGCLVTSFAANLSLSTERERLAEWIIRDGIPVNLLINNAGLGDLGRFESASWDRLSGILEVNMTALSHLTHLLLPVLRDQGRLGIRSSILNVSSVAGFFPLPGMAVYAATKAYVTSFSEALRMELAPEGIGVTALCPGPVPTEFFEVASRENARIRASDRTHRLLLTTADQVVGEALSALERRKPVVVPNRLLSLLLQGVRLLPPQIIRLAINLGAGPRRY
jgi:uncharacterized protein